MSRFINNLRKHPRILLFVFLALIGLLVIGFFHYIKLFWISLILLFIHITICVFIFLYFRAEMKDQRIVRVLSGILLYFGICALSVCAICIKISIDELSKEGVKLTTFEVFTKYGVFYSGAISAAFVVAALALFIIRKIKSKT